MFFNQPEWGMTAVDFRDGEWGQVIFHLEENNDIVCFVFSSKKNMALATDLPRLFLNGIASSGIYFCQGVLQIFT